AARELPHPRTSNSHQPSHLCDHPPLANTPCDPLSLHDALPISDDVPVGREGERPAVEGARGGELPHPPGGQRRRRAGGCGSSPRSEEHTSELQSRSELVCRLLLENKNAKRESSQRRRWRTRTDV